MEQKDLLNSTKEYLPELNYLLEYGIIKLKPWEFLFDIRFSLNSEGLKNRYPGTDLIPFAIRLDCDDIACLDLNTPDNKIVVIHDYSSVGWENREVFNFFWDWFRKAVEDMIEFTNDDIKYDEDKNQRRNL